MTCARIALLSLAIGLGSGAPASAATITWEFDGIVRIVGGSPAGIGVANSLGVAAGTPVHGFVRFESDVPRDPVIDPTEARFSNSVVDGQASFSGWSLSHAQFLGPITTRAIPGVLSSDFVLTSLVDPTTTFGSPLFEVDLVSADSALFSLDQITIDPPPIALLAPFGPNGSQILLSGTGPVGSVTIQAELTSLVRVPEPSALALIALAVLAVRYPRAR